MARLVFSEKKHNSDIKSYKIKRGKGWRHVSLLLEPNQRPWWEDPDVLVAFNLPRISAALERLMGTNVVRLTDRKYMKDLGGRLEEDCRQQLLQRIRARELKEVERERILIIEGKSNIIPPELADDPIFLVNKTANKEIAKKRAKLKTNRERNAEHLKVQGVRWEREHLQHEDAERIRLEKQKEHKKEQRELEERYKEEDAERGMDLLRIDNEDWRACEQQLKEFLERERTRMKERSMRVSTPFTSDPKDIQNIIRARQKFREIEHRIRQELEQQVKHPRVPPASKEVMARFAACAARKIAKAVTEESKEDEKEEPKEIKELSKDSLFEMTQPFQRKYSDDASDLTSEEEVLEVGSSIEQSKRRHAAELEAETERDVQRGLLISKEQYHHLRFEEDKIVQLRKAKDIRELYQLAEEIIIGERFEDEVLEEEEVEEEGEQHEFDDETDF